MATKKYAVLGSPIEHSKSPIIHSTAYGVLGLDWEYGRFEVRRAGLKTFIDGITAEYAGFSVTMPLKEEAARFANTLDEAAQLTGAVNTLVRTETGWSGHNTDVFGIVQALTQAGVVAPKTVLIIGSGATATSAVVAVRQFAPNAEVLIHARNAQTRSQLLELAKFVGLNAGSEKRLKNAALQADLAIATLPGGALDQQAKKLARWFGFRPQGAVLDVAYSPWPSKFALLWQRAGRPAISGLDMLLWQAIAQLRIFTSGSPDVPLHNEVAVVEAIRHALDQ